MKHLKRIDESSDISEMILNRSFKDFSRKLGIDPVWLADYLHECFSFNLDQSEMPFSDEEFEDILEKLEKLKNNI